MLPFPYAATAAYGGFPQWGMYLNGLMQQQQQQQQQQNGSTTPTANGGRRPSTPNGAVTPEQQPQQQYPPVFPAAFYDPTGAAMIRLPAGGAAAAGQQQPGLRLINPAGAPLLVNSGFGNNGGGAASPLGMSSAGSGGRRDSIDRNNSVFSPGLDKKWGANYGLGSVTPPPPQAQAGLNLFNATRLSLGGDAAAAAAVAAAALNRPPHARNGNGGINNLFGGSNLFGGVGGPGGGSQKPSRHNSIDAKNVTRSKLLEDFR